MPLLKRCTFCEHYNIHAVYYPELYNLPLSTICVKLQWPRMYEQDEIESDPWWGFKKDCNFYERAESLPDDLEKQCNEWEILYDQSINAGPSRPEHPNKSQQAPESNDSKQRPGRVDNEESSKSKRAFVSPHRRAAENSRSYVFRRKKSRVCDSMETDQLCLPCGKTNT